MTKQLLILCVCLTGLSALATDLFAEEQVPNLRKSRPAKFDRPFVIEFHGEIDWQLAKYFRAKVEQAKAKPSMAGWFVGQVMKATGGKANPQAVNALIKAKLGVE